MRLSLNVVVITLVWSFGGGVALQPLQAQSQVRSHSGVERVANEMPLPRDYSARAAENSDMRELERASVCARPLKAVARETMKIFSRSSLSALAFAFALGPQGIAAAAVDCETDCLSNCARVAPGNKAYCQDECTDYCQQPDRQDGLPAPYPPTRDTSASPRLCAPAVLSSTARTDRPQPHQSYNVSSNL